MTRAETAGGRAWGSFLWRLEARFKGVEFEGGCRFVGRPMISLARQGRIILGDGVSLVSSILAAPAGPAYRCTLRALAPEARLVVGRQATLRGCAVCAGVSIEIGEGALLEPGALVLDNDFHVPVGEWDWAGDVTSQARPVRIGRGAVIGAEAIVLKGVVIGDGAVVEPGAVVTRDVPAGHRAAGNPARVWPRIDTPASPG
jgi:acetyltransferase-like isoleucine patch superfamily enzyme